MAYNEGVPVFAPPSLHEAFGQPDVSNFMEDFGRTDQVGAIEAPAPVVAPQYSEEPGIVRMPQMRGDFNPGSLDRGIQDSRR